VCLAKLTIKVSMGPGQKFLTRVGPIFYCLGQVGSSIFGLALDWENVTEKYQFFQFFAFGSKKSLGVRSKSTGVKGGSAFYTLRVKSMLGLVWSPIKCQILCECVITQRFLFTCKKFNMSCSSPSCEQFPMSKMRNNQNTSEYLVEEV